MRREITLELLPVGRLEMNRMQKMDKHAEFVCNMADTRLCCRVGCSAGV